MHLDCLASRTVVQRRTSDGPSCHRSRTNDPFRGGLVVVSSEPHGHSRSCIRTTGWKRIMDPKATAKSLMIVLVGALVSLLGITGLSFLVWKEAPTLRLLAITVILACVFTAIPLMVIGRN